MTAYRIGEWESFALGQVGASAALLGLVFVGISINLRDIIGSGSARPPRRGSSDPARERPRDGDARADPGSAKRRAGRGADPARRAALFVIILYLQRDAVTQPVDPVDRGHRRGRSRYDAHSGWAPPS